jgi:hypothetical protein
MSVQGIYLLQTFLVLPKFFFFVKRRPEKYVVSGETRSPSIGLTYYKRLVLMVKLPALSLCKSRDSAVAPHRKQRMNRAMRLVEPFFL